MKNSPTIKKQKPQCPICESKSVLSRKDGIRWCRVCGYEWKFMINKGKEIQFGNMP